MKVTNNIIDKADLKIIKKITVKQARSNEILPIYIEDNKLFILCTNENADSNNLIKFLFNEKESELIIVNKNDLNKYINIFLDYDITEIEYKIIEEAVNLRVSDIHFEPMNGALNIRYRIHGSLINIRKITMEEYLEVASRIKLKSHMDITEKRRPQDGKMLINVNGKEYNCRLSTLPIIEGEKIVIRILYEDMLLSNINNLNFTSSQQDVLEKIVKIKNGLCLINGPTGSGKSTTLYSILNSIRNEPINITTLEDPIEAIMEGVNQINLNEKIGLDFGEGLRRVLRQDPDVIMVGEIRDELTAKMAVRAAITGHKVYSTIHTKDPKAVYYRLEEMGVKGYLIRDAICGIISQRLIKTICFNCREEIFINGIRVYKKKGCNKCNGTGYIGRKVVASVIYIKKSMGNNNQYDEILSNNEMIFGLKELLLRGEIDYYDYLCFIEEEELNEN